MREDGSVDEDAYAEFVTWQLAEGSSGLVPVGTTGESPTLSHKEHERMIEICVSVAKDSGKPVIAGAGSNSTLEAVSLTRFAEAAGADAVLSVAPYYNKPSQEGLYRHFSEVAGATSLPIVIYNIPGRSIVDISVETMARLVDDHENITAVKDATADLARPLRSRVRSGASFNQLTGEDITTVAFLAQGGDGAISVTANVAPRLCAQLHEAWQAEDLARVAELRDRLAPLHDAMFVEPSPAAPKYGAFLLGKAQPHVRLPIVELSAAGQAVLRSAMKHAGLPI